MGLPATLPDGEATLARPLLLSLAFRLQSYSYPLSELPLQVAHLSTGLFQCQFQTICGCLKNKQTKNPNPYGPTLALASKSGFQLARRCFRGERQWDVRGPPSALGLTDTLSHGPRRLGYPRGVTAWVQRRERLSPSPSPQANASVPTRPSYLRRYLAGNGVFS